MVKHKIDTFIKEVEKLGYTAQTDIKFESIIISEKKHYHVRIHLPWIFEAPFDYIMSYIEREIEELKKGESE